MANLSRTILLIAVIGIVVLLIASIYLINSSNKSPIEMHKNNTNQNNESYYIKNITESIMTMSEKVNLNSKPQFKNGDKFEYLTNTLIQGISTVSKTIYSVDNMERINNTDYYIINAIVTTELPDPQTGKMININSSAKTYVNKETGEILKLVLSMDGQDITMDKGITYAFGNGMFATWMLALTDDFKWKLNTIDTSQSAETIEYQVTGREKINERDCFKVEINVKSEQVNKYEEKIILFVDVEKRITVKIQKYYENLLTEETNLVSKI